MGVGDVRNAAGVPKTFKGFLWTKILDALVGSAVAQGYILYRSASVWAGLAPVASGRVLADGGAGGNPSWQSISAVSAATYGIFANSDLPKTSDTTLAADTALDVTLLANKKYRLQWHIYVDSAAAPDWKYDWAFTGTTTSVLICSYHGQHTTASLPTGDATASFSEHLASAFGVVRTFTVAATDTTSLQTNITIEVGASGGTLSFRWAQGTSSLTTVTRRRDSSVIVTECI